MSIITVERGLAAAAAAAMLTVLAAGAAVAGPYGGWDSTKPFAFGSPATPADIAALGVTNVAPDGTGLPPGKGDYAKGKAVYESQCTVCHGPDFQGMKDLPNMPSGAGIALLGGRGTLTTPKPFLTIESYWNYATSVFDYIRRAMPYTAATSLSVDDTYAVTAYLLAEGKIIDKSMVLDQNTLPKVQMPNRDGFISDPRPERYYYAK